MGAYETHKNCHCRRLETIVYNNNKYGKKAIEKNVAFSHMRLIFGRTICSVVAILHERANTQTTFYFAYSILCEGRGVSI